MIELKKVKKQYDGRELSYDDAKIESCESLLLTGASGAGKTTLFNMISGLTLPSAGEIFIDGTSTDALSAKGRNELRTRRVGYVFQDFRLLEDMSVEDNIRILELSGVETQNLRKTSEVLGIAPLLRRKARTLSGGEKQRVAIARALVKMPEIILADEPTGNLDEDNAKAIISLLLEVSEGRTLIVASHDLSLAKSFERVLRLTDKGAGR